MINVILDLDNTCIYGLEWHKITNIDLQGNFRNKWYSKFKYHIMPEEFVIFERPGLQSFLTWLFKNYTVSVWSAGTKPYVDFIVDNIIQTKSRRLKNVLNFDDCEESHSKYRWQKDLRMLYENFQGYDPSNTLIIDDLDEIIYANPANSIYVAPFIASAKSYRDNELDYVKDELKSISKHKKKFGNRPDFELVDTEYFLEYAT
jgi:hypothetical protein